VFLFSMGMIERDILVTAQAVIANEAAAASEAWREAISIG
jgi:hypothetical protein